MLASPSPPGTHAGAQARDPHTTAANQPGGDPASEPSSFEDLRWPVGTRLQCLVWNGPREQIVSSTLIGYLAQEYVIIRTPAEKGRAMLFEPGNSMRIRAFSGMYVCEFKAEVDRVFSAPIWYLHLLYPRQVRVQKLRSAPRVKMDLPVTVTHADGRSAEGCLLDLSINGAQLAVSGLNITAGQGLSLSFELEGDESVQLRVHARVAAARGNTNPPGSTSNQDTADNQSLGLAFDELDSNDKLRISNFVYQKLLAGA